jgi:predicted nucleic acid-binding protein
MSSGGGQRVADTVIDSTIVIDYLRGKPDAVAYLDSLRAAGPLVTHVVVVAEVLTGARDRREQAVIDSLLSAFRVVYPDEQDARTAIDLLRQYRPSHGVGWLDCLIGSTSVRQGLSLATLNTKHFAIIPGLRVVRPY